MLIRVSEEALWRGHSSVPPLLAHIHLSISNLTGARPAEIHFGVKLHIGNTTLCSSYGDDLAALAKTRFLAEIGPCRSEIFSTIHDLKMADRNIHHGPELER